MKEVRDVIEMSGKTVFRDGRSHYKKTGIILGIVLTVTFLAGRSEEHTSELQSQR